MPDINFHEQLTEYAAYFSELGVEGFDVEMLEPNSETASAKSEIKIAQPVNRFEKTAPPENLIPARAVDSVKNAPATRKDLLDDFKISKIRAQSPPKMEVSSAKTDDQYYEPSIILKTALPGNMESIENIREDIGLNCKRCRLCEGRTQVVNSVGNLEADLMFVGEAPGADEDLKGEPFVGRAGQLLTKIIESIGFDRETVFIGNINRCRPPENRQPQPDEAEVCKPFLLREIDVVKPKVIVVLGNTAAHNLLNTKTGITTLRGKFLDYHGSRVMPTFHPAYLLRDPRKKRETWEDMKMVRDYLKENEDK